MKLRSRAFGWVIISVILLFAQALLPPARGGLLIRALFDAGHVPLFGLFALVLLISFRRMEEEPGQRPYWLAAAGVTLMGALSELAQGRTGRDAELMDFVHDLLGAAFCLLVARAVDRSSPLQGPRKLAALGLAFLLLGVSLMPIASLLDDLRRRNGAFPTLFEFEQPWEDRFLSTRDAQIEWVDAGVFGGRGRALEIRLGIGAYPAVIFHEPAPNWTGHERFVFEIYTEHPTHLYLRVDDAAHNGRYGDRFDRRLELPEGITRVEIALADIEAAPAGRSMDLERIHSIALFGDEPGTVVVDQLRLE